MGGEKRAGKKGGEGKGPVFYLRGGASLGLVLALLLDNNTVASYHNKIK